jgi:manganese-dependent inorganic pyrophosphatase
MKTKTKTKTKTRTYVIGHANPDTDSIAAAMGYAWLLDQLRDEEVIAARAGSINAQSTWALERLDLRPPVLLTDASPMFGAVTRRLDTVTPDDPLGEAWAVARRTGTVAPVVDSDDKPRGMVTGQSLFNMLGEVVGPRPGPKAETTLAQLFAIPALEAADTEVPCFERSARIRDGLRKVLREERDDFFVTDDQGRYVGVCRKPDLLEPPRINLVLVDHNEMGQSIGGLDEAVLLEVLDHHRLDNPPTRMPICFHVDPVGSTSTLVAERIEDSGLGAPAPLAGILLAGLLSDTLIFTSPTATDRDRRAAERLGRWALVSGGPLAGETVESFGQALLAAGADISNRDPDDVVSADLKTYEEGKLSFGVAQAEVTDIDVLADRLAPLQEALERLRGARGLDFAALLVTDVVRGTSRLLLQGAPAALDELPYPRLPDGTLEARDVVSRKRQLLPALLSCLEG